ncbi:1-deoxy-D-xylulose-5-phosphate synthase [Kibdelosporangium philippinense]|uniref:1-deoxy-D-xylulose-5-phosphate synthase n=1 Tax=Kibdelosporangium philippinense TaxID=211113 RepID=A0ABS8ZUK1_9PSEU|nr:1-deoxy-D-xylulose-5-phosphate synthase [Kibdelosporangium philippinense]MCE7011287.1 1-deoxy-D-xylulose-5-phosphate synthase [Kibdelosporangium philippinense]
MSATAAALQPGLACDPATLRSMGYPRLRAVAGDIRQFLIENVCRNGGHLGPNLGVVELTLALHRVFRSPRDRILFDTGHQAYVHKIVTGRQDFTSLRLRDGLSGYPSQAESVHDIIENSHASTALSYADGFAKADEVREIAGRTTVAVVGDGALTGGMCWEALNNIGGSSRPVVVVLNDNGRSYAATSGGIADHLADLRMGYGPNVFEELGFVYIGPVDGHDLPALEHALREARSYRSPVVVHCVTVKGNGFAPAEADANDRMHAVGPSGSQSKPTWTDVFASEIVDIGAQRDDVVCLTASMLLPTGLGEFARRFPKRIFDVGIAEQHMVTSAAGLAMGGCHPVVAVYSTFLNRAFDQVLMDVALHRLPVTFVLDRAGITGPDGASHHGVWDIGLMTAVPGLRLAAPRDPAQLRELLREAVVATGPTVVRFPKASAGESIEAIDRVGPVDILRSTGTDVLLVSMGPVAEVCLEAAALLEAEGVGVTVVDPRWIVPCSPALAALARAHRKVFTVEDGGREGSAGSLLAQAIPEIPVHTIGYPRAFIAHASRQQILESHGFTGAAIAATVLEGQA